MQVRNTCSCLSHRRTHSLESQWVWAIAAHVVWLYNALCENVKHHFPTSSPHPCLLCLLDTVFTSANTTGETVQTTPLPWLTAGSCPRNVCGRAFSLDHFSKSGSESIYIHVTDNFLKQLCCQSVLYS